MGREGLDSYFWMAFAAAADWLARKTTYARMASKSFCESSFENETMPKDCSEPPKMTSAHCCGFPSPAEYRKSGSTPPLTATSPWQVEQYRWYKPSPFCTVAALAVARGGCNFNGAGCGSGGRLDLPSSLNASTRLTFCTRPDFSATSPNARGNTPPQPTTTAMYCSPLTEYEMGAATMPPCASADHSFSPVAARYASRSPSAVPSKTRFPAVESTPPLTGLVRSTRQTSFCWIGSQAARCPLELSRTAFLISGFCGSPEATTSVAVLNASVFS